MSFNTLPSDILFDLFTSLDDLADLHAIVTVNRYIYTIFNDGRARILRNVFQNQICKHPRYQIGLRRSLTNSEHDTKLPIDVLNLVNAVFRRAISRPDELTLRTAAWSAFLKVKSPLWVFASFGNNLVSLCEDLKEYQLCLSYAAELWGYLRTRQFSEYLRRSQTSVVANREANKLALKLADMYFHRFSRPMDAARTIQECYDMNNGEREFQFLSKLVQYIKIVPDQDEILYLLRQRAQLELLGLILAKPNSCDLHSTFCFTVVLRELDKYEDAIYVFNNTLDAVTVHQLDPISLTALARRLVASLMKKKYYDEALTIRGQMLDLLSQTTRGTTSLYLGWAKQYIWELYHLNRTDEALIVEEQCWDHARTRLSLVKQRSHVYAGRNAAWSLCRSYEKRGQRAQAKRVRWEYEVLARDCLKPGEQVPWPGEEKMVQTTVTKTGARKHLGWATLPNQAGHNVFVEV